MRSTTMKLVHEIDQNDLFEKAVAEINEKVDIDVLKKKYHFDPVSEAPEKYLNMKYVKEAIRRTFMLNLHQGEKKSILDIGCGPGYFLFINQLIGHDILGLDLDTTEIYNELTQTLEIKRIIFKINTFEPMYRFDRQFDVITAFATLFNYTDDPNGGPRIPWKPQEWEIFLKDIKKYLRQNGILALGLNVSPFFDGKYYNDELLEYFHAKHATIDNRFIFLKQENL